MIVGPPCQRNFVISKYRAEWDGSEHYEPRSARFRQRVAYQKSIDKHKIKKGEEGWDEMMEVMWQIELPSCGNQ